MKTRQDVVWAGGREAEGIYSKRFNLEEEEEMRL